MEEKALVRVKEVVFFTPWRPGGGLTKREAHETRGSRNARLTKREAHRLTKREAHGRLAKMSSNTTPSGLTEGWAVHGAS